MVTKVQKSSPEAGKGSPGNLPWDSGTVLRKSNRNLSSKHFEKISWYFCLHSEKIWIMRAKWPPLSKMVRKKVSGAITIGSPKVPRICDQSLIMETFILIDRELEISGKSLSFAKTKIICVHRSNWWKNNILNQSILNVGEPIRGTWGTSGN